MRYCLAFNGDNLDLPTSTRGGAWMHRDRLREVEWTEHLLGWTQDTKGAREGEPYDRDLRVPSQ